MNSLRTKGVSRSITELNPVLKEINRLKKIKILNGIKKVVTTVLGPNPDNLPTFKKELKKKFRVRCGVAHL